MDSTTLKMVGRKKQNIIHNSTGGEDWMWLRNANNTILKVMSCKSSVYSFSHSVSLVKYELSYYADITYIYPVLWVTKFRWMNHPMPLAVHFISKTIKGFTSPQMVTSFTLTIWTHRCFTSVKCWNSEFLQFVGIYIYI